METTYQELRCKDVINVCDGKRLGRVCDIVFRYPEYKIIGILVPGKFTLFKSSDLFIDVKDIQKIGADAILVNVFSKRRPMESHEKSDAYEDYE